MAPTMKVENETIEYYLYIIIIKLAVLASLKFIKTVLNIHTAYKKSLKRKYTAKDIEATKPKVNENNQ